MISAVGDKFFSISIAWWVLSKAGESSKFHLGLVMAMNVIPVVLFGPLLGTLSDRSDKRLVMLAADAARSGLVLLLAGLLWSGRLNLYWLCAICFLSSGFGPLFESAVAGSFPRLTSEEKMPQAVAADSSVMQFSNVIGSALGSVLMAAAGVAGAFLLTRRATPPFRGGLGHKDAAGPGQIESTFTAEFRKAWPIYGNKPVLWLILSFAAFNFFVGPIPYLSR